MLYLGHFSIGYALDAVQEIVQNVHQLSDRVYESNPPLKDALQFISSSSAGQQSMVESWELLLHSI